VHPEDEMGNLFCRSELHPKALEKQMPRHPVMIEDNKKPLKSKPKFDSKSKADDQSHKPARHIEETARLASSVETAKDPGTVQRAKD
jgi:hypothetical protein